ncbi:MAG: transcription antitermination factor NusB [Phycisphaerae bacterium]|nr:transcription antitermination factor NusB [Phycisphaerae bacterium]
MKRPVGTSGSSKHHHNRSGDPRSLARRLALQFIYQLSVQRGGNLDQIDGFLGENCENSQAQQPAKQLILGCWRKINELDQLIKAVSSNWDLSRISLVDRCNLRLAVYQLQACPEVPPRVVINEAVELAKSFSTAQAPAFVNGILDAIWQKLKQQDDDSSDVNENKDSL